MWQRSSVNSWGKKKRISAFRSGPYTSPIIIWQHSTLATQPLRIWHARRKHLSWYLLLFKIFIVHYTPCQCPHLVASLLFVGTYFESCWEKNLITETQILLHSKDTVLILLYHFTVEVTHGTHKRPRAFLSCQTKISLLILKDLKPLDSKHTSKSHPTPSLVYFTRFSRFNTFTTALTLVLGLWGYLIQSSTTHFCKNKKIKHNITL